MNTDSQSAPPHSSFAHVRVSATGLELWRGERCLFDNLSFSMKLPVLHVRGANGSGKTTLLKVLCGLTATEQGEISWTCEERVVPISGVRGLLAYSGHQDALNPALTAQENLLWGAGLYRSISDGEVRQCLAEHNLEALLPLLAGSLSAGQKRRISLLRSVMSDAPVWVWDEPYANLDQAGIDWVNALIAAHVDRGGCLVLSAHQSPALDPKYVQTLELVS